MNLKKQLFAAFIMVAIVPLVVISIYMFVTNLMLAFNLYEQNLQNSTEIQADLVVENINRLMVRTGRFASSSAVRKACQEGSAEAMASQELSKDILNFTDETLDNVALFALVDTNGNILYSSGSNSDTKVLTATLQSLATREEQYVSEVMLGDLGEGLLIDTPVWENSKLVGRFLAVCRTDYFLRIISGHKQVEASNALIYCANHQNVVVSKMGVTGTLHALEEKLNEQGQGSLICEVGQSKSLVYYRTLSKTPWVLVSTLPVGQILSRVWSYGLVGVLSLLLALLAVLLLSRRQSNKMLRPLELLLDAVVQFFLSGASKFTKPQIDPKTEIGYLAGKFAGISDEITSVQGKLRESNYLYATLLQASYEFHLTIDLLADTAECSSNFVDAQLKSLSGSAPERVLAFLRQIHQDQMQGDTALGDIVYGRLYEPAEAEVCCNMGQGREECWYRLITVPIVQEDGTVARVVLHFEDITTQKHREFRLIHTSQVDPLCGLFNKASFPLYCQLSEPGKSDCVFFIDLDQFKQVNDTFGHAAGDEVLIAAAQAIRAQFREGDAIGRFGGDEFVAFAPGMTQSMAERKAVQLIKALSFERTSPQGSVVHVTASVGICIVKSPMTLMQAIQIADESMYHAKQTGRAQYCLAGQAETGKEHNDET